MNKLGLLLQKIKTSKFELKLPPPKKLLIFDDESFEDFKYIIQDLDYFLLVTRFQNIKTFHIHHKIFFKMIKNFRGNFWSAYLVSLIEIISPKVIITCIDNSFKFYEIAKLMEKKVEFYAIQGGARYDLNKIKYKFEKKIIKKDTTKDIYIPNFFCFGEYEKDDYKKNKINIKNFIPVGSLRLSNFLEDNKISDKKFIKKEYDICMISDGITRGTDNAWGTDDAEQNMTKFAKYIIRYCLEKNKKLICCFKRLNSSTENFEKEIKYYKDNLTRDEYDYLINHSTLKFNKKKYLSYELMLKSEITISAFSTMLRENLALGNKIIVFNPMINPIWNFPLDGLFKIENCDYIDFKNKVDKVFSLDNSEFLNCFNKPTNYIMEFDDLEPTYKKIKKTILEKL